MPGETINLRFPLGGLNRRFGYQGQPPFTTPDCGNVRPDTTIEGRARGGSRPGLGKLYASAPVPGSPVRLLNTARQALGNNRKVFIDPFAGSALGDSWEAVSGESTPLVSGGVTYPGDNDPAYAVYEKPAGYDSTAAFSLSIDSGVSTPGTPTTLNDHECRLFAHMDDTTPNPTQDGVTIYVRFSVVGPQCYTRVGIEVYSGGSNTESYIALATVNGTVDPGTLLVSVSGSTYTVKWNGSTRITQTITTSFTSSQTRVGFGFENGNTPGQVISADNFTYRYGTQAAISYDQKLLCSANGRLFYENSSGELVEIGDYTGSGGAASLASDRRLRSIEFGGKLYIADWSEPTVEGTDGVTSSGTITSASVSDWSTYATRYDDAVELFNHDNSGDGTYSINGTPGASMALGGSPPDTSAATGFRVIRAPKYYDLAEDKLYNWHSSVESSGAGQLPLGCKGIGRHQGRIVLFGSDPNPNIFYMTRQGNALDLDYSENDAQSAVSSAASFPGVIGHPIIAWIEVNDDRSVVACRDQLYVLLGNPASGGLLDNLSVNIGVVTPDAYCVTPGGDVVIVGRNGVYIVPGGSAQPVPLSDNILPDEFRSLGENDDVRLAYDVEWHGVHIFITRESGAKSHFWVSWDDDPKLRGFWPVTLPEANHEPSALATLSIESKNSTVVALGCADGYVRSFSDDDNDDGTTFESYIVYGPTRCAGGDYNEGVLSEMVATLAEDSGDVDWILYVGETNELAATLQPGGGGSGITTEAGIEITSESGDSMVAEASRDTGTWTAGRNYADWTKSRGGAFALKLSGTGTSWSLESLTAKRMATGRQKKL